VNREYYLSTRVLDWYSTRYFWLGYVDGLEPERVQERGDGSARVLAGGVEDSIGQGRLLELVLRFGAGLGFEVLIRRDQPAGVAGVDARALVVERGDKELRCRQGYCGWRNRSARLPA